MHWRKQNVPLFPFLFALSITHWLGQNDTSVCWLTNPLTQSCINFSPRCLLHYAGISVCKSYRMRVWVHPPKWSISSCDLINNNTTVWVHDLYSADACVESVFMQMTCICSHSPVYRQAQTFNMRPTYVLLCFFNLAFQIISPYALFYGSCLRLY